jgi:hypothetical protein
MMETRHLGACHPTEVHVKGLLLAAALVLTVVVPVRADVRVDIGINLPGPPTLAVIPGAPVYYAPHTHANVFFYGHQYWLFHAGGWHVGPGWNGPWVVVSPVYVPAPILHVPVRYYKAPPGHWRHWRHDAPPRWEAQYGRDWREDSHERSWREREERWHHHRHGKHKDGDTDRRHGKAKGRDRD